MRPEKIIKDNLIFFNMEESAIADALDDPSSVQNTRCLAFIVFELNRSGRKDIIKLISQKVKPYIKKLTAYSPMLSPLADS